MDVSFYQTKPDVCNGVKPLECKVILIVWNLATASKHSCRTDQMQGDGNNLDCAIARICELHFSFILQRATCWINACCCSICILFYLQIVQSSFQNESVRLQVQACVFSVCGLLVCRRQTLVADMSLGRCDHFFPQLKLATLPFINSTIIQRKPNLNSCFFVFGQPVKPGV